MVTRVIVPRTTSATPLMESSHTTSQVLVSSITLTRTSNVSSNSIPMMSLLWLSTLMVSDVQPVKMERDLSLTSGTLQLGNNFTS